MVNLSNVTNVTFDKIKFDYNSDSGTNKPFLFNGTKGISIVNSEVDGMISGGYGTGQGTLDNEHRPTSGSRIPRFGISPRLWLPIRPTT